MNEVFPSDHSVPSEPLAMGDDGNLGEKGEGSEIVEGSEQVTGVRQISKASNSSLKRKLGEVNPPFHDMHNMHFHFRSCY